MITSKVLIRIFFVIAAAAASGFAQQEFVFTTTPANASGPRALIDMPGLTGNLLAIIVATPLGDTEMLNQHPIGVWYIGGKWYLCNVDIGVLPPGAKYKIQFFQRPGPNAFLHYVTSKNLGAEGSYIDSPALNNNPNAQVKILVNHAPDYRSPSGLYQAQATAGYSSAAGRWYIGGDGNKPLYPGQAFNVVVSSGLVGTEPSNPNTTNPNTGNTGNTNPAAPNPNTGSTGVQTPPIGKPPVPIEPKRPDRQRVWTLQPDPTPSIAPNAKILLFIHGMDSRAEEADDITKALFDYMANRPTPQSVPSTPPVGVPPQNAALAPVLQGLLQKYKGCILEKYETKTDMTVRGLDPSLSGLASTNGLQERDTVACVAGNLCSRSQRLTGFAALQAQANSGNAANFQTRLEQIIPKDCFQCAKHQEYHTKHVHCTMEAGGNFGVPQGIAFETCKAGVDLNALAMTINREINAVINNITGTVPPTQATGGPSIATNYSTVSTFDEDPESCPNPDDRSGGQPSAVLPAGYYEPLIPTAMLDTLPPPNRPINVPAAHNIGLNEGRLRPELRKAAADADPLQSLRLAAYQFADGNTDMGKAYADLSVTGRRSFAAFRVALPGQPFCQTVVAARPAQLNETNVLNGCYTALDRAYRVANFLRTGQRGDTPAEKTRKTTEREALGWIAVSGEDDQPHRPVNVPSSDYPQYDIDVVVEAPLVGPPVTVRTRYVIAQSYTEHPTGTNLVVISLDLPTSGYSENLNYDRISPLEIIGRPKWTPLPVPIVIPPEILYMAPGAPLLPPGIVPAIVIPPGTPLPDFEATGKTPLLDFIENFVVRFAETLDQRVPVKNSFVAVMGGSLGGNMTFRLGRRPGVDWLPKFIVWSPASIWNSLGEGSDILKHIGPRTAWERANAAHTAPGTGDRALFFGGWDQPILPILIPMAQSDTWTSDYYRCKKSSVAAARLDRHETYDANFLAWHWRLGGEQLLYSHQTIDPTTGRPRYLSNQKPMFLSCGTEDRVKFNDICPATQRTAPLMTMTPGKALFLERTGHSLDNERRNYFARQIVEFLGL